jgi:hypothetical protein
MWIRTVLLALSGLTLMTSGCGKRTLPPSVFSLTVKESTPAEPPLVNPDFHPVLEFTYTGTGSLTDAELKVAVWTESGKEDTYPLYVGSWQPNTMRGVRLRRYRKPLKIVLQGKGQCGREEVVISVRWLLKTKSP